VDNVYLSTSFCGRLHGGGRPARAYHGVNDRGALFRKCANQGRRTSPALRIATGSPSMMLLRLP